MVTDSATSAAGTSVSAAVSDRDMHQLGRKYVFLYYNMK